MSRLQRQARILVVEPSAIVSEGLLAVLGRNRAFRCLTPLSSLEHFSEALGLERPDLVILNPLLAPDAHLLQQIKPPLLALFYTRPAVCDMLAGFSASFCLTQTPDELFACLNQLLGNRPITSDDVNSEENYELSDREIEVLRCVAQGLMNKEIADKLHISINTVITHRKNINRKTGIKSVAGLTVYAIMQGIIAG